ncbi:MAG: hypothetical protein ACRD6B_03930 [Bryobacteraceae bacterium]
MAALAGIIALFVVLVVFIAVAFAERQSWHEERIALLARIVIRSPEEFAALAAKLPPARPRRRNPDSECPPGIQPIGLDAGTSA